jgi:hypothetical protein
MSVTAEQAAVRVVEAPRRADVLIVVQPSADASESIRTGQRLGRQLGSAFPHRQAAVLLLADRAGELVVPKALQLQQGLDRCEIIPWSRHGQSAVEAVLRAAETFDASACALVAPHGEHGPADAARLLLSPILDGGFDFVCPCYTAHRFEGVLGTGMIYPLTRALFGKRLRQPIGSELAFSRRLASHLLGEGWHADPAHAGEWIWLVTAVLSREFQVCQSYLGARPPRLREGSADLAATLAHAMGMLFHEMRMHAAAWQRTKGSQLVRTYGDPAPGEDGGQPQIAPMLSAFQLGYQELGRLWSVVLPPQSLLALKRLTLEGEATFALEDALWARIVYDFAIGYHLAVMDRPLLLRSMTPLYLGWAAGFVRQVRDLDPAGVEERVERLCRAFEAAKPYLISRWRWPDRFNP